MATRRNVSAPSSGGAPAVSPAAAAANPSSSTAPAVPTAVITKLLLFTLAMVVAPLGSYYVSVSTVFKGNNVMAGAIAAVMANVVLISYVVAAIREDSGDAGKETEKTEGKKAQ